MSRVIGVALALLVSGCGAIGSSPSDGPSQASSQAPASDPAGEDASPSPASVAEPDGTFVFVPMMIDCPGGCRTSSVSKAFAEPGVPGNPRLIAGALVIEPDGTAWLCEFLTGVSPPGCGGIRLRFDNIELYGPSLETAELQEVRGLRWLDSVTISGEVTRQP